MVVVQDFGEISERILARTGDSPSGKAPGSGPGIRGFESLIPSQDAF